MCEGSGADESLDQRAIQGGCMQDPSARGVSKNRALKKRLIRNIDMFCPIVYRTKVLKLRFLAFSLDKQTRQPRRLWEFRPIEMVD